MKTSLLSLLLAAATPVLAADAAPLAEVPASWHAQTIGQALLYTVLFAVAGIILAFLGYKAFDKLTPGDLHSEIVDKQNVAAAIVAASVILGICIIIAAAMIG
jgi:uncharacterized membrane protein YjfL (UPF0719 family)